MFNMDEMNYLNANANEETNKNAFMDSLKFQMVVSQNQKDALRFYVDLFQKIEGLTEEEWQTEVINCLPFSTQYNAYDSEEYIREYGDSVLLDAIS